MHATHKTGVFLSVFASLFAPAAWAETQYGLMSFQSRESLGSQTEGGAEPSQTDWTGFYLGGQLSTSDQDLAVGRSETHGGNLGVHAGYDYDFGAVVLGGGLEFEETEMQVTDGADLDGSITRLKFTAGYDLGRSLVYGTIGAAQFDSTLGNDEGAFGGIGLRYQIADQLSVGGEFLSHHFGDVDGQGGDIDAQVFSLRGAFRF